MRCKPKNNENWEIAFFPFMPLKTLLKVELHRFHHKNASNIPKFSSENARNVAQGVKNVL